MASIASSSVSPCCYCSSSFATVLQPYSNRSNLGVVAPLVQRREKFSAGKCSISLRGSRESRGGGGTGVVRMGLRAVESYDASFQLAPECEKELLGLLKSDTFCSQVAEQADKGTAKYTFTGELFQPVPWSPATKHGMPQEYEKYLEDKEQYLIINVPPNFMFQAKIFKPSRLCAVYQRVSKD